MAVDIKKGPATRKTDKQENPFVITKRLKRKIDQINRVSKENQLIYKEVSEKPLGLFNESEVRIKAGELEYCAVRPNYDENSKTKFRNLIYLVKPTETIEKNMDEGMEENPYQVITVSSKKPYGSITQCSKMANFFKKAKDIQFKIR